MSLAVAIILIQIAFILLLFILLILLVRLLLLLPPSSSHFLHLLIANLRIALAQAACPPPTAHVPAVLAMVMKAMKVSPMKVSPMKVSPMKTNKGSKVPGAVARRDREKERWRKEEEEQEGKRVIEREGGSNARHAGLLMLNCVLVARRQLQNRLQQSLLRLQRRKAKGGSSCRRLPPS